VEFSGNPNMIPAVVTVRAAAALPAAGAYEASAEVPCAGYRWLSLYLSYDEDPATAAGAVTYFVELRPAGSTVWYADPSWTTAAVAAGADTVEHLQRRHFVYTPVGTATERWRHPMVIGLDGVEAFRVQCAESGAVGAPGVFSAVAEMAL